MAVRDEAAPALERALALGLDGNAALRFNYDLVLESLGRKEEAAAQMRPLNSSARRFLGKGGGGEIRPFQCMI